MLSPQYDSADGLAWSPDGKEIWFTAAKSGYTAELAGGKCRQEYPDHSNHPGRDDLAGYGAGRPSLGEPGCRTSRHGNFCPNGKSLDISWHDWDIAKDISRDGQSVLFEDASEAAPTDYVVAIRKIDGTPPVQLGEGSAGGLSPDGKWAICILPGSPGRMTLFRSAPANLARYL